MDESEKIAMVKEAASLMGKLFISRRDAKSVYVLDGADGPHWATIPKPFKMSDFTEHLTGQRCLGSYLLDADSTVRMIAFDLDLSKYGPYLKVYDLEEIEHLEEEGHFDGETDLDMKLGNLEEALHDPEHEAHKWSRILLRSAMRDVTDAVTKILDMRSMCVITGGGAHVLVPFGAGGTRIPAADARAAAVEVVTSLSCVSRRNKGNTFWNYGSDSALSIEIFPKQDEIPQGGYGNLIRLPFGWHHEAGIRTFAIDPDLHGSPNYAWRKMSSLKALRQLAGTE